jgi:1-acyl-sn-glycerol-3-phosphate acyltransferase
MGKEELTEGLVTGLFFRTVDIPVNRESNISSFRAFKKAIEKLENGVTMIIFPEGKIADDYPPVLHAFKNGPFRLAIESKIPVVPVTSLNTWQILWDTGVKHGSKPGICRVFVHKPIETSHLTIDDADSLRDEVRRVMKEKFEEDHL